MSANVYHPSRGGVRGGKDQFNWEDVKADKDRENYLGHSVKAPVGRWQKGKDLIWYTRDKQGELSEQERRKKELQSVKDLESQAMAAALGYKVPLNTASKVEEPERTKDDGPEGDRNEKRKRKKEKSKKKKKKQKRKYRSSDSEEGDEDRYSRIRGKMGNNGHRKMDLKDNEYEPQKTDPKKIDNERDRRIYDSKRYEKDMEGYENHKRDKRRHRHMSSDEDDRKRKRWKEESEGYARNSSGKANRERGPKREEDRRKGRY